MNFETRIQLVKDACDEIYDKVQPKYAELKALGSSVKKDRSRLAQICTEALAIIDDVNEGNLPYYEVRVGELQKELNEKYGIEFNPLPEIEETAEETKIVEKETIVEKSNVKAIVGVGALGALLGGLVGFGIAKNQTNNATVKAMALNNESTEEETEETIQVNTNSEEENTETKSAVEEATIIVEEAIDEEEKTTEAEETVEETAVSEEQQAIDEVVDTLVLGEYGTFFDIDDNAQVEARAQYIYDNYFANNDSLTEQQRKLITPENIANTIRIMNGNLPVNEEGYEFFDGMTLNEYTNVLVEAALNVGSNVEDHYTYFPAYLLTIDGSEESEFIKSYSVIYEKLVYALNEHDDEQVQDAIACLGFKFYNEWYLQGMYGDTNPHLFRTDLKYLTFIATIEPFRQTAMEWHLSERKPVCISVCKNYETGEKELVPVNNIVTALETGEWNNVGAKLAGMDVEPVQWLAEYYEALNDSLSWKYDHLNTLKLG